MKQKRSYIISAWFVLASFLFVQTPFALFHDHAHKVDCVYTGGKEAGDKTNSKHLHENNVKPCFACSVSLTKDFVSAVPVVSSASETTQKTFTTYFTSYYFSSVSGKPSRGPPVI